MKRVVVIGGGNLAESLSVALTSSPEVELLQIYLRNKERGEELQGLTACPYATFDEPLATADIYLLAVSDTAIGELSRTLQFPQDAIVAHTAGSTSIEAIEPTLRRAVFYPMQSFTRGRIVDFEQIPIFVEAKDDTILNEVKELAYAISQNVIELDSEQRRKLHLSAVFVCNFVNAMFMAGEQLVAESSLPFDTLKPLIEECCAKACDAVSPRDVQTGPAVRGDWATMERHAEMLGDREELKEIYQNVSKYIWETLKKI